MELHITLACPYRDTRPLLTLPTGRHERALFTLPAGDMNARCAARVFEVPGSAAPVP